MNEILDDNNYDYPSKLKKSTQKNIFIVVALLALIALFYFVEESNFPFFYIPILLSTNGYIIYKLIERIKKKNRHHHDGQRMYPYKKFELSNLLIYGISILLVYTNYTNNIEFACFILSIITFSNILFISLLLKYKKLQFIVIDDNQISSIKDQQDYIIIDDIIRYQKLGNEIILFDKKEKHIIYMDELEDADLLWIEIEARMNIKISFNID